MTEEEVRENVKPLFYTRMRLGEFDPEDMNPYTKIDYTAIQVQPIPMATKFIELHYITQHLYHDV